MNDKIKRQIEWLISDLLSQMSQDASVVITYETNKGEAKVYLNGYKIATISEQVSCFDWALTERAIAGPYKACTSLDSAEEVS